MVRFLDDPRISTDSNHVERALRAVAVGRRNHHWSRSDRGIRALLHAMIESARLTGVEPRAYMKEAAVRGAHSDEAGRGGEPPVAATAQLHQCGRVVPWCTIAQVSCILVP